MPEIRRYFYDTEFVDDGVTIELISIGIVDQDGREYYAVNEDMPVHKIHEHKWLMANVWPHLPTYQDGTDQWIDPDHPDVKPHSQIASEVHAFLLSGGEPELWAYFAAYDHVALAQLWGPMTNLPPGIPMLSHELVQLWEDAGRPVKPPEPTDQHNALADARWDRELWQVCTRGRGR